MTNDQAQTSSPLGAGETQVLVRFLRRANTQPPTLERPAGRGTLAAF